MKHTLTASALICLLALTGCGKNVEQKAGNAEPQSTNAAATHSPSATPSPSPTGEGDREEDQSPAKVGESTGYYVIETDETVLTVRVESVEPITGEQCTTSYFDSVPEGKQLVKLSVSAEAGSKEALEAVDFSDGSLGFWESDWGWVDAEGYKIQRPYSASCINEDEKPADSLTAGQKTRGLIVLEIPEGDVAAGRPYYEAYWAPFPLEWEQ